MSVLFGYQAEYDWDPNKVDEQYKDVRSGGECGSAWLCRDWRNDVRRDIFFEKILPKPLVLTDAFQLFLLQLKLLEAIGQHLLKVQKENGERHECFDTAWIPKDDLPERFPKRPSH